MIRLSRLFWKLFLAFWLATSLTFFLGAGLLVMTDSGGGDPKLDALLLSEAQLLEHYGLESGRQLLAVSRFPDGQGIGVYDSAGQLVAGVPVSNAVYERSLVSKEGSALSLRSSGHPHDGPGRSMPLIIGTVMSALFSGYMAFYLAWPLAYLRRAMSDVAQGRFETRVKPLMGRRRDEIADLAEDCDRMANQLKLLVDAQQQLLHDISHELRSPLTRMQAAIGLLQQDSAGGEMLGRIERESVRMDTLIEALLTLARVQGRPESIERESVDVVELLAAIVEDAQFEAGIKGCQVELMAGSAFVTYASGELLCRCFENVIRNAVRYTGSGTTVLVTAEASANSDFLSVLITDHGPGVEDERLRSIFYPFERGAEEASVGFGLGLAIAWRALEMHGGTIFARNAATGGLVVEITLPRAQSLHDITLA